LTENCFREIEHEKNKKALKSERREKKNYKHVGRIIASCTQRIYHAIPELETTNAAPEVDSDGIITLTPSDTEKLIRDKIVSSLKPRYPMIENRDFEFVKVVQKKISVLQLGKGTQYDYSVVKKLAGQGLLYIRMKQAMQFAVDEDIQVEDDMADDPFPSLELPSPFNSPTTSPDLTGAPSDCNLVPDGPSVRETPLDIIDEIPSTFYGEQAEDRGGPRKEWIRLCNQKIQPKYFEQGLKEHLASDYFYIGQMAAIALLQNGQLPVYIPETVLQNVFTGPYPSTHPCISNLQKGLDTLGIHTVGRKFPQFLHLFRPSENAKLSVKRLLHLLIPTFSEKGSNSLKYDFYPKIRTRIQNG
ncbi:hypothetical protein AWC38_SpisGene8187, partial [Paramuricea clavata]